MLASAVGISYGNPSSSTCKVFSPLAESWHRRASPPSYSSSSCSAVVCCSAPPSPSPSPWRAILEHNRIYLPLAAGCCLLSTLATTHSASASASAADATLETLLSQEPSNALSIPTWTIHVASVAEWIVAMSLVWKYGNTPGNAAWKGLSWGMVPLLGGAMCACTWHFFYNSESLEILVALQAGLTMVGNFTMWIAAYRIYQAAQKTDTKA